MTYFPQCTTYTHTYIRWPLKEISPLLKKMDLSFIPSFTFHTTILLWSGPIYFTSARPPVLQRQIPLKEGMKHAGIYIEAGWENISPPKSMQTKCNSLEVPSKAPPPRLLPSLAEPMTPSLQYRHLRNRDSGLGLQSHVRSASLLRPCLVNCCFSNDSSLRSLLSSGSLPARALTREAREVAWIQLTVSLE
jgi:hypothetical protein